jgi:BlaI family penicillinase repressor
MNIKELTKAEEQVMQILWQLKEAIVKEIIERMPEPKPAYNTVSTVVRVLEGKSFIDHKAYGNSHVYFSLISEAQSKKFTFDKMMSTISVTPTKAWYPLSPMKRSWIYNSWMN